MSKLRIRVASSDWWASRNVVSVTNSRSCSRTQRLNFSAPIALNLSRLPSGTWRAGGVSPLDGATSGGLRPPLAKSRRGTSGCPLTITSPRYASSLVARSWRWGRWNSSGVSSMKHVVTPPARNAGCVMRLSRNGMFVLTPRTRNSSRLRFIRRAASRKRRPWAVTFTSIES